MPAIITEYDEQELRIVATSTLTPRRRAQVAKWGPGQWVGDWIVPATVVWTIPAKYTLCRNENGTRIS